MSATKIGADALKAHITALGAMGEADLEAAGDEAGDARDYRAMADATLANINANLLQHPSAEHREGYLRALVHLLSVTADGFGVGEDWDPVGETEAAFSAAQSAKAAA
jgi:hypothetical protein